METVILMLMRELLCYMSELKLYNSAALRYHSCLSSTDSAQNRIVYWAQLMNIPTVKPLLI